MTVIADVCGTPLKVALDAGVDVVKLSLDELLADGWADSGDAAEIAERVELIQL